MENSIVKMQYLADKIRELRKKKGWNQSQLAEKSFVTHSAISKIEKGDRSPTLEMMIKISKALGVCVSYLIGDFNNDLYKSYNFYKKYGIIENLSAADREYIKLLAERLNR